mmetsp:Transcript_11624/g.43667  ORF Transcript_11624/g.43667 Transcript_11624/m.43667 type:complete len:309 (+) Transcript_11624:1635-2561(+)
MNNCAPVIRRNNLRESSIEILLLHLNICHINSKFVLTIVDLWVDTSERAQGRFSTQSLDICSTVAHSLSANGVLEILSERRAPMFGVNLQNFASSWFVREFEVQFSVKTTRTSQSRIDCINAIGGSNHNYLATIIQSVHESEESAHNTAVDVVLFRRTHRCQSVNLIKENDAWLHLGGLFKKHPQLLLSLSHPLGENIRTFSHKECDWSTTAPLAHVGNRSRHQCFSTTRRTAENHTLWWIELKFLENLRVHEWKKDHLLEPSNVLLQSSNAVKCDILLNRDWIQVATETSLGFLLTTEITLVNGHEM